MAPRVPTGMNVGNWYEPFAVDATPVRAAPSVAVIFSVTGCISNSLRRDD